MTTFTQQVGSDGDDAYDWGGTQFEADSLVWWNFSSSTTLLGGSRFNAVTVANGDFIEAGTFIELYPSLTSLDDIDFTIHAEAADDSAAIEGGTALAARDLTSESVRWTSLSAGVGFEQSPDIPLVIQEVTDRGGWASGQDLTIIGVDPQLAVGFASDDYSGTAANAAKITINHTPGGSAGLASQRLKSGVGR